MNTVGPLKNKTALITGGSKGIGLGIAERMAKQNMRVAITGRNEKEVKSVAEHLVKLGASAALGMACDVRSLSEQEKCVNNILDKWGGLEVVIANAGVGHFAPVDVMQPERWNEVIDINLTGVFYTLKASVNALKQSHGYFITMASLAGANFFPEAAAYNASKFGLVGFSQAAMLDLRPFGIKVTTIMPGSVASHFNSNTPSEKDQWKIQPEDIGQIVIDLLQMHPRTLPSKIEVRPSQPPGR